MKIIKSANFKNNENNELKSIVRIEYLNFNNNYHFKLDTEYIIKKSWI